MLVPVTKLGCRSLLGLVPVLCLGLAPSTARGEGMGQALVRNLDSPWAVHPLTDANGKVPLLVPLPAGTSGASLGLREMAPGVATAWMTPDEVAQFDELHPEIALSVGPPLRTMLEASGGWTGARAFRETTGGDGTGVAVGVVDTGIDLTHPGFRTADGHTRVAWLLTWGAPRGLHPEIEDAMGCNDPQQSPCAVYSADDIDAALSKKSLPDDMRDRIGHGTHVAGIAAGSGANPSGADPIFIGMAPKATLIIAAPTGSGGFPDPAVLRGASFVFDRAQAMGLPAVVNLSLGGDFGPHDGTSALETGLAALVGDGHPGRAIVVAAGNSGALYKIGEEGPAGIRTEVRVDDHAPARVPVLLPNTDGGQVYVWVGYRKGDDVSVGLEGPEGTWIPNVEPGDDVGYDDGAGTTASVFNNDPDRADSLNPNTHGAVISWSGKWTKNGSFAIDLAGHGDVSLWVTPTGAAANSGAYFPRATKAGTISTPATSPSLFAVGCSTNRLTWHSFDKTTIQVSDDFPVDSPCYYSSAGPTATGLPKPELLAPGGFVISALSTDADPRTVDGSIFDGSRDCPDGTQCYVVQDGYVVSAGTSMSTPHVAGAMALLLQRDPNLTQSSLTEILQASARYPTGTVPFESAVGAGSLSLEHALDVMPVESQTTAVPDGSKSWWLLGDETARPDPTFPVWATLELRLADGSIVSGLDEKKISVLVDGGRVVSGATRVRHGLFRFAVAGEAGSGGTTMRIEVLYDGVPIGTAKELPIGADPWIDSSAPTVEGGCTIGDAGSERAPGYAGLAAVGVLAFVRRARRNR